MGGGRGGDCVHAAVVIVVVMVVVVVGLHVVDVMGDDCASGGCAGSCGGSGISWRLEWQLGYCGVGSLV